MILWGYPERQQGMTLFRWGDLGGAEASWLRVIWESGCLLQDVSAQSPETGKGICHYSGQQNGREIH